MKNEVGMNRSVCVVGGGFGGLTAAALLARDGWDVTLLEKNDTLGGRARVWHEDGFAFDMGPSWYLMPEVFERFFSLFDRRREDYYQLQKLNPYYRVFFGPGDSVDITGDMSRTEAIFESFEPGGAEKLRRYLAQAEYKYDVAMREFLYRDYRTVFEFLNRRLIIEGARLNVFSSLDRFVRKYFTDRRARQILQYAMVFLGSSPSNAPALYSIMSHIDLNLGVWFPRGGMGELVSGVVRLAREMGVKIKPGVEVKEIEVKQGRVAGVTTENGNYPCDAALINADYAHAELELLEAPYRSYPAAYWKKRVLAPAMFIVYLGLRKKLSSLAHHNLYFSDPWEAHFDAIFRKPSWPEDPSYYVSCASFDDPAVAPEGQENIFFLVPVASGLEDSDEVRNAYAEKIIDHFEKLTGETIRDAVIVRRIYSQRDFSRDYNAYRGTALGIAHTLFQTAVFRPAGKSKKVSNLYYSGQYTHPGIGVPMTFISSEVTAARMTRELL